jgi:NADPH:quinone reductase-like Zn-dependent oxidoreductase
MDLPEMMKAVRFHEHGGPEVLRYEDAPVPAIGPNDALVKVRACALNHLDVWTRIGVRGWQIPMPHILGNDVSGEVVAVGSEADHLYEGMECFVHPGIPGEPSLERLRGDDNIAADYGILGLFRDGGYAEYVKVKGDCVFPKPDNLSWEETAAFPLTFLTAWHMLGARRARAQSGESVLVVGGSSGVGVAAIQIARAKGCRVIATVGNAEKAKRAIEIGADATIDHYEHAGKIHKQVFEHTGGMGVDIVVEHVGPAVFGQCLKTLKRGGRLVTCGATTGPTVELDLQLLFAKHLTVYGSFMGSMSETLELLRLIRRGIIKPVVDSVLPLKEAVDAHRRMEQSEHFGKIVLKPEN